MCVWGDGWSVFGEPRHRSRNSILGCYVEDMQILVLVTNIQTILKAKVEKGNEAKQSCNQISVFGGGGSGIWKDG